MSARSVEDVTLSKWKTASELSWPQVATFDHADSIVSCDNTCSRVTPPRQAIAGHLLPRTAPRVRRITHTHSWFFLANVLLLIAHVS